jgi:hypothetical protein
MPRINLDVDKKPTIKFWVSISQPTYCDPLFRNPWMRTELSRTNIQTFPLPAGWNHSVQFNAARYYWHKTLMSAFNPCPQWWFSSSSHWVTDSEPFWIGISRVSMEMYC